MLTYPSCPKKPKTKKRNSRPKRHRKIGIESPKGHEHRQLQFNLIYISDSFITISYVHAPNTVKRYSELRKTISMSHRAPQLYWVLPAAHVKILNLISQSWQKGWIFGRNHWLAATNMVYSVLMTLVGEDICFLQHDLMLPWYLMGIRIPTADQTIPWELPLQFVKVRLLIGPDLCAFPTNSTLCHCPPFVAPVR